MTSKKRIDTAALARAYLEREAAEGHPLVCFGDRTYQWRSGRYVELSAMALRERNANIPAV